MKGEKKKGKKGKKGKSIPQKCIIQPPITVDNYNDGTCDQLLNTKECKYDGHDCDDFNNAYPNCKVDNPKFVGDKYCDGAMYNTTECGYDGGDCVDNSGTTFGCSGAMNGYCENEYNIPECGYDGGDCDKFNSLYPKCKVPDPSFVGKLVLLITTNFFSIFCFAFENMMCCDYLPFSFSRLTPLQVTDFVILRLIIQQNVDMTVEIVRTFL